jgi:prepilin-type processing-associated H-X9-DG protein
LIELLVVIAIVIILGAMTLSGVIRVRQAAERVKCVSNLRQIGIALTAYTLEHRGKFPQTTHTAGMQYQQSWIFTLKPYLEEKGVQISQVRICPADPRKEERLQQTEEARISSSYVLNDYVSVPGPDSINNLDTMPSPSRTITVFIGSDELPLSVFNDHVHARQWFRPPSNLTWNRFLHEVQADRFGGLGVTAKPEHRTIGSANYLFADGHVETISAAEMKRRCDEGENFANP